jgi:hypothetical protein
MAAVYVTDVEACFTWLCIGSQGRASLEAQLNELYLRVKKERK